MIAALKQLEAGRKAEDVAREVGVSKHTIYAWKANLQPAADVRFGIALTLCTIRHLSIDNVAS